jgi:hypothetical protein
MNKKAKDIKWKLLQVGQFRRFIDRLVLQI